MHGAGDVIHAEPRVMLESSPQQLRARRRSSRASDIDVVAREAPADHRADLVGGALLVRGALSDGLTDAVGAAQLRVSTVEIDRAVGDALRDPAVQERITGFGLVPNHASGPDLGAAQAAHLRRWEAPIKASGFKAE